MYSILKNKITKYRYLLSVIIIMLSILLITNLSDAFNTESSKGKCVQIAHKIYNRAIRWGYLAKIVTGTFKGRGHQWVEYFYKDKWRVWDEAIWYVGKSWYTAEELGYKPFIIQDSYS